MTDSFDEMLTSMEDNVKAKVAKSTAYHKKKVNEDALKDHRKKELHESKKPKLPDVNVDAVTSAIVSTLPADISSADVEKLFYLVSDKIKEQDFKRSIDDAQTTIMKDEAAQLEGSNELEYRATVKRFDWAASIQDTRA